MTGIHRFLIFVFCAFLGSQAYAQDSVSVSNQKRIEDLRARVSRLSNESTDSLILMLRQVILQQRDSMNALNSAVDRYEENTRQFSYSVTCNCHRVYYDLERYEANYSAYPALDSISSLLKDNVGLSVKLVGHADNTGTAKVNQALALKRAENLKKYLIGKHALAADRIITEGRGSDESMKGILDPYLFHLNRRVEIFVVRPGGL